MRLVKIIGIILIILKSSSSYAQENVVADLKIRGNKKIKTSFIKKITKVAVGSKLDSLLLEEDIRRLKRLPSVAHAYYQVFLSSNNEYNVFYSVEENFTIIPLANVYTTNDEEFAEPVFLSAATADYRYNNTSYEVLGLYQIDFKNRVELGINYFTEDYRYISGATDPAIPLNLNVKKLLYKFVYDYDNLDYYYQFVSGFKSILNFQYVTSRNTALPEFAIGWNDFLYFKRIGKKGNLANRLRLGISSNDDSPFAPFSVDNNLNIRGVGNTIDRGTGVIILNTEYRHTLYEKDWFILQSNTFIDAGSWRNPGGDFGDFGASQNIRVYPGVGFRFISKKIYNATFRIDYGVGITKDATNGFVFGIGQYF